MTPPTWPVAPTIPTFTMGVRLDGASSGLVLDDKSAPVSCRSSSVGTNTAGCDRRTRCRHVPPLARTCSHVTTARGRPPVLDYMDVSTRWRSRHRPCEARESAHCPLHPPHQPRPRESRLGSISAHRRTGRSRRVIHSRSVRSSVFQRQATTSSEHESRSR